MFGLFKRKKANINLVTIPIFDLNVRSFSDSKKDWINEKQSILLSLNFFNKKPDIPTVKDIGYLRQFYRDRVSQKNGGNVQVDLVDICGMRSIRKIFKIPDDPSGIIYLGSITIPFKECSYVVKVQAVETGMTGVRDSMIFDKLIRKGDLKISDDEIQGWSEDPYDSEFKHGLLMNRSEYEKYDADFEDHPLSIMRVMLDEVESKIELNPLLKKQGRFEY